MPGGVGVGVSVGRWPADDVDVDVDVVALAERGFEWVEALGATGAICEHLVGVVFRGGERAATTAATWPVDGRLDSRRKVTLDDDDDEEGVDAEDDDDGVVLLLTLATAVMPVVSDKMSTAPSITPHSSSVASSRSLAPSYSMAWRLVTTISSSYNIFLSENTVVDGATCNVTVCRMNLTLTCADDLQY